MMRKADWETQKAKVTKRCLRRMQRFGAEEDGSLILFAMFLIIAMLVIAGLGVDLMLYEAQRTRLQATLDRAVLAAAHPEQTRDRKEVVMSYFTSAGLGGHITKEDISVEQSGTASEVSAKAKMHVDPLLLQFIGMDGFDAVAQGTAAQSAGLTEVSLVVDISGSMGDPSSTGFTKLSELQKAGKQFVNILLCNPDKPNKTTGCTMPKNTTSISLVPYQQQVVAGPRILKKFNRAGPHDGSYCASFYEDEFETTAFNAALDIRQTARFDYSESYEYESANSDRFPCKTESWREIFPLSQSHTALGARLDGLQAGGWTSIDIGLKWGVTLLDPSVNSVVKGLVDDDKVVDTAFSSRPYPYNFQTNQKVVVLMTDGENTFQPYLRDEYRSGPSRVWQNTSDPSKFSIQYFNDASTDADDVWYWPWQNAYMDHPYGDGKVCVEWYYAWGNKYCTRLDDEPGSAKRLDWQDVWLKKRWGWWMKMPGVDTGRPGVVMERAKKNYQWNSNDNKDTRLLDLCTAAKNKGIKIYTIELETSGGGSGGSVLKSCATSASHYFKVEGVDLVSTFSTIGQDIAKLRLTQ